MKKKKDILAEYESNIKFWKKSGTHCLFYELCPADGLSTSPNMEYVHGFLVSNQNLLDVVLSQLPAGVFSKSARNAPSVSNGAGGVKGRKPSANTLYTEKALSSISSKKNMVESKASVELQSTLNRDKREEKNHRRELFSVLQDHCGGRNVAKTRLGKFKKHKSSSSSGETGSGEIEVGEVGTDDEDAEDYTDSQESLLGDIFEADQQIEEYSVQLKAATERVKTYIK